MSKIHRSGVSELFEFRNSKPMFIYNRQLSQACQEKNRRKIREKITRYGVISQAFPEATTPPCLQKHP
jgi:hypothetical protein